MNTKIGRVGEKRSLVTQTSGKLTWSENSSVYDAFSTHYPARPTLELNGTVSVRKIWDGRAQLEEIEADGPKGHWEGLTLFLYNPQSHQWSQSFINSKIAALSAPLVGAFKNGRG